MLRYLLEVEKDRLEVARRIEKERDIVFPETTIIIRDIIKLMEAIEQSEKADEIPEEKGAGPPQDSAMARIRATLEGDGNGG